MALFIFAFWWLPELEQARFLFFKKQKPEKHLSREYWTNKWIVISPPKETQSSRRRCEEFFCLTPKLSLSKKQYLRNSENSHFSIILHNTRTYRVFNVDGQTSFLLDFWAKLDQNHGHYQIEVKPIKILLVAYGTMYIATRGP